MFKLELQSPKFVFQDVILFNDSPVFLIKNWTLDTSDVVCFEDINDMNNNICIDSNELNDFATFLARRADFFKHTNFLNLMEFYI